MATARETIKRALRKLRVIAQGESPDSATLTDALSELNAMLRGWAERTTSWPAKNYRVNASTEMTPLYPSLRFQCESGGITLTLPLGTQSDPVPDGMRVAVVDVGGVFDTSNVTLARNGWKIEGAAANLTLNTENLSRVWMFRADLGDWKRLTDLAVDDDLPFPTDFDLDVALMLARRLGGEFGQRLSPEDSNLAGEARRRLNARYAKPIKASYDLGVTYMSGALNDYRIDGYEPSVEE